MHPIYDWLMAYTPRFVIDFPNDNKLQTSCAQVKIQN
jgi:hypothetical protein